jgi:hypothetical protein
MPTFDVDREETTASELDGKYISKQYFESDGLCQKSNTYYNSDKYQFRTQMERPLR